MELNILPPREPPWYEIVEWRPGRWDPMSNAPRNNPNYDLRGRTADGRLLEPMHFADGGGEEQPPYRGWFIPVYTDDTKTRVSYYTEVHPVEWQPLRANPDGPTDEEYAHGQST